MMTITNEIRSIKEILAEMAQIIKRRLQGLKKHKNTSLVGKIIAERAQLNKRNGVSCFPLSRYLHLNRSSTAAKGSVFAVACVVLSLLLDPPVLAATLAIRQEACAFPSETAHYVSAITFMIASVTAADTPACSRPYVNDCIKMPVVHFQLGSAGLSTSEKDSILSGIQQCEITKTTPLHVTGYTCPLGDKRANSTLSLSRARTVADFLRASGFTVEDRHIQGRGQDNLVTHDPDKFALNRRVEISTN